MPFDTIDLWDVLFAYHAAAAAYLLMVLYIIYQAYIEVWFETMHDSYITYPICVVLIIHDLTGG